MILDVARCYLFFLRGVLDEIVTLTELISEGFKSYSCGYFVLEDIIHPVNQCFRHDAGSTNWDLCFNIDIK